MKKGILIALGCCLLATGCSEKKAQREKSPVRVKTTVVSPAMVSDATQYVGIVEENEGTAVSFTGMGVVKRVLVSEGQSVGRGQLLAELDDTQARNLLSGAEAQMAQANDALQRYQQLHDNGSLPEMKWVEIQSQVAQATAQLATARKNLADCRLVAPVSGVIGAQAVKAGETALPSQAVVTILDISRVKVKVSVPEAEISGIGATTPSHITVEAAQVEVPGGRIEKGVVADPLTHTYDIHIQIDNQGRRLLPGMVANVKFVREGANYVHTKSVPVTSVQKAADGTLFVWVADKDKTVHRAKVTTGSLSGNNIGIIDGIDVGQRIVTEGYQKLSEGSKVVF